MIKKISADELKRLNVTEGLVLQGCGGDLQEWQDGINAMLTEEGMLRGGDTFKEVYAFEHGKLTNLLFGMDDVNVDAGKLAMWRLRTRGQFGGKWLSDYRVNTLGMASGEPLPQEQGRAKPEAPIIGADANVFNIIGIAARALRRAGMPEQAKEMSAKAMQSGSYDEALGVIMEYVEPADVEYAGHGMMMEMGEI